MPGWWETAGRKCRWKLKIGLKCGGSDGFSGITANPLLGCFSDYLVAQGGTTVLTEVPEMFGAETLLMARCKDAAVFRKTVSLINGFKDYFISRATGLREPLAGKQGRGISTLEEKSLGCTQKSGTTAVCDVLEYGETCLLGTEFAECSRQRPCGQYRFGGLRMPYRAVHDRTRHTFRYVCAHREDFVPHRISGEKV